MSAERVASAADAPVRPGCGRWTPRIGSKLLLDAWSADGQLLLRAGARVTTHGELDRLLQPDVRFGSERTAEMPLDLTNEAALEAAELLERRERATTLRNEAVEDIQEVFQRIEATGQVDVLTAEAASRKLTGILMEDARAAVSLIHIKDADAYTFTHSVNVGILSAYLAMHTEYRDRVEEIGLGALLHDIGKVNTPVEIIHKPGPLNAEEMDTMKRHPLLGAELLARSGENRASVISCALSHHEKVCGGGYPQGRLGPQIPTGARIVAIADIYDALITNRPYREAYSPRSALDLMSEQMSAALDPALFACFRSIMGLYPIGSEVVLSDGRTGTIINRYATDPERPSVVIDGGEAATPQVVDLSVDIQVTLKGFKRRSRSTNASDAEVEQMRLAA